MKSFEEFQSWYEENREQELKGKLLDSVSAAQQLSILDGESDLDSQFAGMVEMVLRYTDLKLEAYHEWLTGQIGNDGD